MDSIRTYILKKANEIVNKDRQNNYGTPEDNFKDIGIMWGIILGQDPIPPHVVANMMIALKLARTKTSPLYEDNYIDMAGYAACGGECAAIELERHRKQTEE